MTEEDALALVATLPIGAIEHPSTLESLECWTVPDIIVALVAGESTPEQIAADFSADWCESEGHERALAELSGEPESILQDPEFYPQGWREKIQTLRALIAKAAIGKNAILALDAYNIARGKAHAEETVSYIRIQMPPLFRNPLERALLKNPKAHYATQLWTPFRADHKGLYLFGKSRQGKTRAATHLLTSLYSLGPLATSGQRYDSMRAKFIYLQGSMFANQVVGRGHDDSAGTVDDYMDELIRSRGGCSPGSFRAAR